MYLIIGASGMLGSSIMKQMARFGSPEIYAPSHAELPLENFSKIDDVVKKMKPRIVIDCAGMTNVDACEKEPTQAMWQNGDVHTGIAVSCRRQGAKYFYISTDYVFDGKKGEPYVETDATNPLQHYGKSKLRGEGIALENRGFVFRVQWLYGSSRNNFVSFLLRTLRNAPPEKKVPVSDLQRGSPCSTDWIARVLLLAETKDMSPGVYNVSHDDSCSRWILANAMASYLKKDPSLYFEKQDSFGSAPRPMDVRLSNRKLCKAIGFERLGSWKSGLVDFIQEEFE